GIYSTLAKMEKEGKLKVRYEASHHIFMPSQLKTAVKDLLELRKYYEGELLKFNTIKIHFDGVNEINTAAVLEDFANEPGNKGATIFDEKELKGLLLELAKEKINLHLHTVGDRSVRIALNAMEQAQKEFGGKLPMTMTLSHLEVVSPEDMKRFKELGVYANFTPHWLGGTVFKGSDVALGAERFAHNQPVNALVKANADVTFSSDVVSMPQQERANPFMGIQMGMTRQEPALGKDTKVFGQESDRVSLETMLKGYTINNAKQLGISKTTGSLEVGKSADFIVIPENIFKVDVYDISKITPEKVYLMGKEMSIKK
ncbi:amidohydrolase, partial [bacterium DOLZORAL124_38_8]